MWWSWYAGNNVVGGVVLLNAQIPMVPPPLLSNQAMMQLCKTSDVGISRHVILHNNAALPPPPTPSLQSDIPPSSYRTKPEGMLSGLHRSWRSERRRVFGAGPFGTTATVITKLITLQPLKARPSFLCLGVGWHHSNLKADTLWSVWP